MNQQEAFDTLKETLSTVPVLEYPDFSMEFILEPAESLKDWGAVLFQEGRYGKDHVIANVSWSLHPLETSMHNYNSANWSC